MSYEQTTIEAIKLLESQGFIVIDPIKEVTVQKYADTNNMSRFTVNTWLRRKKLGFRIIPHLNNLKLVRLGSEVKSGK